MMANADESWNPQGATGIGTRLLIDLALNSTPPAAGSLREAARPPRTTARERPREESERRGC